MVHVYVVCTACVCWCVCVLVCVCVGVCVCVYVYTCLCCVFDVFIVHGSVCFGVCVGVCVLVCVLVCVCVCACRHVVWTSNGYIHMCGPVMGTYTCVGTHLSPSLLLCQMCWCGPTIT